MRMGGGSEKTGRFPGRADCGGQNARDDGIATITIARLSGVSNSFPIKRIIFPVPGGRRKPGKKKNAALVYEQTPISEDDFNRLVVDLNEDV